MRYRRRLAPGWIAMIAMALAPAGCLAREFELVPQPLPRQELVGEWLFDDAAAPYRDSAAQIGDGLPGGAPRWLAGAECAVGGCLWLDNTALTTASTLQLVTLPDGPILANLEDESYTLSAWFDPLSTPPSGALGGSYAVLVKQGNHEGLSWASHFVATHWGPMFYTSVNTDSVTPGSWHHVAMVVDAALGTMSIYLDGQASAAIGIALPTSELVTGPWRIGSGTDTYVDYNFAADARVDQVRIYRRALAADEIGALAAESELTAAR